MTTYLNIKDGNDEETEYIAKAASSLYKLTRIHLVKKERFDEFMKHIYADLSGPEEERKADDRMESVAIVAEDKGAYPADREGRTR